MKLKGFICTICAMLMLVSPITTAVLADTGVGDLMSQFAHDKKIYEEKLEAMDKIIAKAEEKKVDLADIAELKKLRDEFASWQAPAEAAAHAGDNATYYAIREEAKKDLSDFKAKAGSIFWETRKELALARFDAIVANWTERINNLKASGGDVTQLQALLDQFKGYRDDVAAAFDSHNVTEVREVAAKLKEILIEARDETIKIRAHILVDVRAPPVLANATSLVNFLESKGANATLVAQAKTLLSTVQDKLNEVKQKADTGDFEGAKAALKQAHESWKEFRHIVVKMLRDLARWRY